MKNTTKNIKFVPTYACKLGKGKFVGAQPTWQCRYCGAVAYTTNCPGDRDMGSCTNSSGHWWTEC